MAAISGTCDRSGAAPVRTALPIGSAPSVPSGSGRTPRFEHNTPNAWAARRSVTSPAGPSAMGAISGWTPASAAARSSAPVPLPPTVSQTELAPFSSSARIAVFAAVGSGSVTRVRTSHPLPVGVREPRVYGGRPGIPTSARPAVRDAVPSGGTVIPSTVVLASRSQAPVSGASGARRPIRRRTAAAAADHAASPSIRDGSGAVMC